MRNIFLLILGLIFSIFATGQSIYGPVPEITTDDLEMNSYYKDADAGALVLYDYGETYFEPTEHWFVMYYKQKTRIKILKESGMEYAEIRIGLYNNDDDEEELVKVVATTYNLEDGKIVTTTLDKDQIFYEKTSKNYRVAKFALPNVKPGSIIEYSFTKRSQFYWYITDWYFQWDIPVIHSEFQIALTPYFSYKYLVQGANRFDSEKTKPHEGLDKSILGVKYKEIVYNYVIKDIPAFKDADFITTREDYIIKMDWQLVDYSTYQGTKINFLNSWEKIIKELNTDDQFGKFISKAENKAGNLIYVDEISKLSDREKVMKVLDYVKKNFHWNKIYREYSRDGYSDFLKTNSGNSADINLLTMGLLRAVGIECNGLISSTRSNGRIYYEYPFIHYFNYVLIYAHVDGKPVFLDATNPYLSNWQIPEECISGKGLLINKGDIIWIPIETDKISEISKSFEVVLTNDETAVDVDFAMSHYYATDWREAINSPDFSASKDILKDRGIAFDSVVYKNLSQIDTTLFVHLEGRKDGILGPDKVVFTPFFDEIISENPMKAKERKYPIDFIHPYIKNYKSTIHIPEGYVVEYYLIEPKIIDNELFSLSYQTREEDDKIILELSYQFKKSNYPATAYPRIKSYFNEIVKLGQEKMIFRKK